MVMESAYLYVRVSTDDQKKTGYSLIEQEERLLNYCEINKIKVRGVFREDYSAKDFNRPEWKKLIAVIKRNKHRPPTKILVLKWDRFSRNIGFAYQMISILKELNVQAVAIDQPVDFEIPESIVTLAIYLSIPEAENSRRGRNCSDGMRRAKKMGRWPAKAPVGYCNQTSPEGKKILVPKQPEADHVRWSFEQFAKGLYTMNKVKKMACLNGFQCSRNNFWKLLRNPIYCGLIKIPATKTEDLDYIKGVHEPIISKTLFDSVQQILVSKRKPKQWQESQSHLYPLRGFLHCPFCNRKLTSSQSTGRNKKYGYYHCSTHRCKGRFKTEVVNEAYEALLSRIHLCPGVFELFQMILQDQNVTVSQTEYHADRKIILADIEKQKLLITKARKLLMSEKIDSEDFREIKNEYKDAMHILSDKLNQVNLSLMNLSIRNGHTIVLSNLNLADCYKRHDIAGQRHMISFLSPSSIGFSKNLLGPLKIKDSIRKIITFHE